MLSCRTAQPGIRLTGWKNSAPCRPVWQRLSHFEITGFCSAMDGSKLAVCRQRDTSYISGSLMLLLMGPQPWTVGWKFMSLPWSHWSTHGVLNEFIQPHVGMTFLLSLDHLYMLVYSEHLAAQVFGRCFPGSQVLVLPDELARQICHSSGTARLSSWQRKCLTSASARHNGLKSPLQSVHTHGLFAPPETT